MSFPCVNKAPCIGSGLLTGPIRAPANKRIDSKLGLTKKPGDQTLGDLETCIEQQKDIRGDIGFLTSSTRTVRSKYP
jgi:hypothetical protein